MALKRAGCWVALKRAGCWVALKRAGCSVLLNGVQNGPADNVTCAVGNDHCLPKHKVRVLFAKGQ